MIRLWTHQSNISGRAVKRHSRKKYIFAIGCLKFVHYSAKSNHPIDLGSILDCNITWMIVNKVLQKWSKPVSGTRIPYQWCVLEIHLWLSFNGRVLLWEAKGDGSLQQKYIHLIDCMLCSVMMIKLVCHGVDDWKASKRIDLAAKNAARCIASIMEGSSNLEVTLSGSCSRHKVNGASSFRRGCYSGKKDERHEQIWGTYQLLNCSGNDDREKHVEEMCNEKYWVLKIQRQVTIVTWPI
jgi:hypothetical protein